MILVVDDDPDIRAALCDLLEVEGYSTAGAANGQEALDRLHEPQHGISLVLLDMMMPVMDGRTFLEEQQKDHALADIPVVVVTAGIPPAVVPPAKAIVRKPVAIDRLLQLVGQHSGADATHAPS